MFTCSTCHFWLTHGHRLGICTFEPLDPIGTVAPASADAVGITLAIEYSGNTATAGDTTCENYEPLDDSYFDDLSFDEEDD